MLLKRIREILEELHQHRIGIEEAISRLRSLPYEELGFAKLDHHRVLRRGFPEVVFCQGKTVEQVRAIVEAASRSGVTVLATRATPQMYEAVKEVVSHAEYYEPARMIVVRSKEEEEARGDEFSPTAVVISAGTADMPVAEEAALTAELFGMRVIRIYDVGVAGLHRLLDHRQAIEEANVVIVVAGMEGALPSVVAGLIAQPVIAVPTSVGYGASFQGLSALLTMLNSCSPGLVVVNIDNGFGAGYFAALIGAHMRKAWNEGVKRASGQ
ncbi:MAG: nickel pincer cofactor biosynthesis protein LarB [Armatimonadota bacterium]|nr:nickel pincer cofactor biosynthesis protein LarB [Armatimonadota bacterium]MCX7776841.1 nickel pincer cofactor biosynthesis protein LarB [Armatimonadota bacterium]MDW8024473.1 nickel pincer cofactor biosynthesis protein LarB [Armatimonadota bacterium]